MDVTCPDALLISFLDSYLYLLSVSSTLTYLFACIMSSDVLQQCCMSTWSYFTFIPYHKCSENTKIHIIA